MARLFGGTDAMCALCARHWAHIAAGNGRHARYERTAGGQQIGAQLGWPRGNAHNASLPVDRTRLALAPQGDQAGQSSSPIVHGVVVPTILLLRAAGGGGRLALGCVRTGLLLLILICGGAA